MVDVNPWSFVVILGGLVLVILGLLSSQIVVVMLLDYFRKDWRGWRYYLLAFLLAAAAAVAASFGRFGKTYEQWDNSVGVDGSGHATCGVYAACRNAPPYIVDLPYVPLTGNRSREGCSRGYSCIGICAHAPLSPWICTDNNPKYVLWCSPLADGAPLNPKQLCTEHP